MDLVGSLVNLDLCYKPQFVVFCAGATGSAPGQVHQNFGLCSGLFSPTLVLQYSWQFVYV